MPAAGSHGALVAVTPTPVGTPGYIVGSAFYFVGASQSQATFYDGSAAQIVTGSSGARSTEANHEQILGGASFGGMNDLFDVRELVSVVGAPAPTEQFVNYESIAPQGGAAANLVYVGNQYVDQITADDRLSASSINATPQVIDILPHAAGPPYVENPQNSETSTETSPALGTLTIAIATNADGSYSRVDNASYPGGSYVQDWQMGLDFSGSHTVTYGSDAFPSIEDTVAAPSNGAIEVAHSSGNGSVAPSGEPPAPIVDWYPGASGGAPVLYMQNHQNIGSGKLPGACSVPKSIPQASVWDIRTTIAYFDVWGNGTAAGTYSTTTQDQYDSDEIGELCVTNATTILAFSSQSGYLVGRFVSSGALALQTAQISAAASPRAALGAALLSADAGLRLRATTRQFVRRLTARAQRRNG